MLRSIGNCLPSLLCLDNVNGKTALEYTERNWSGLHKLIGTPRLHTNACITYHCEILFVNAPNKSRVEVIFMSTQMTAHVARV